MARIKFYRWKMGLALALALALIGFAANKGKAQPFPNRQQILADIRLSPASPVKQNSSQPSQPKPANTSPIQFKRPPLSPRGAPGNRKGGGTRDGDSCSVLEIKERLMAFVPAVESDPGISHVWGLTVEASPTLWFYVPYLPKDIKVGELEVWDETDSDPRNYQQIYQGAFSVNDTPGAIALTLPSTVKLEPEKNYHWYLSLNMNCDQESQAVNVNGWIQRVKLNNNLPLQQQSAERNRVIMYAENGIWYDGVTLLGQMRRRQPETQILLTDWQKLLRDIGLEEFANKPIVPCCKLGTGD
ncbi:MAG: DUF928 domain-containing protein [Aulosira sp. DedQUE10]|nr:DUF928 domain-containing protein [Aulosira sp. DedQUE10]